MTQLRGSITELVEDGQPPLVRLVVLDAAGKRHELIEKLPIVSTSDSLPATDPSIACLVRDVKVDAHGRRVVTTSSLGASWCSKTSRTVVPSVVSQPHGHFVIARSWTITSHSIARPRST